MTYHPKQSESWTGKKKRERGERAVERQLDYQEKKSREMPEDLRMTLLTIKARALGVRKKLEEFRSVSSSDKALEVGSGAHGLIFGFDDLTAVGLDPLAVEYRGLFPLWQGNVNTVAAIGEELPFEDDYFEVVLSDNVVDHAADPVGIMHELARVLKPKGILYFTVNTHHPVYQPISVLHGLWNALGIRYEIVPFADHTIHFTEKHVKRVFDELPVEVLWMSPPFQGFNESNTPAKGLENKIKRIFQKNILFEVIATKSK